MAYLAKAKTQFPISAKCSFNDYKSAFLAKDSTNHAVMAKMTEEELNEVFLFLIDIKRD